MIRLKKLELYNFRSFKGNHLVDFPEKGLVLIKGIAGPNESTSGVGKSALLSAIAYAFDYCPFPATKIQNWFDSDPFWVKLTFAIDNDSYVLTRGPSKLSLSINGQEVKGGKSVVELKFKDLLRISPDMLEAVTYRQQRTRSLFFSKTDSKKKEFLSKILGLEEIEEAYNKAHTIVLSKAIQIDFLKQLIESAEKDIAQLVEPEKWEIPPEYFTYAWLTEEFEQDSVYINWKINLLKEKIDFKIAERANKIANIGAIFLSEIEKAKKAIENYKSKFDVKEKMRIQKEYDLIPELKKEKKKLESELALLNANTCHTCNRIWHDNAIKSKIDTRNGRLELINSVINKESELFNALSELIIQERDENKVQNELYYAPKELENQKNKAISEEIAKEDLFITRLQKLQNKLISESGKIVNKRVDYNTKNAAILGNKALYERVALNYTQIKTEKLNNVLKLTNELSLSIKEKNEKQDFCDLIGKAGFLGSIFEEVLNDISFKISDILKSVPNVSNCTIQFQSSTETEKGVSRSKITPVVYRDGVETIPDLLSGGQLSSLELATDLAVASVIQARTGKLPCWLIEDEAFDGLSNIDKENCLELLKKHAADKLIMIVDHSTEVKEFFDKVIDIELVDGKNSRIKQ